LTVLITQSAFRPLPKTRPSPTASTLHTHLEQQYENYNVFAPNCLLQSQNSLLFTQIRVTTEQTHFLCSCNNKRHTRQTYTSYRYYWSMV